MPKTKEGKIANRDNETDNITKNVPFPSIQSDLETTESITSTHSIFSVDFWISQTGLFALIALLLAYFIWKTFFQAEDSSDLPSPPRHYPHKKKERRPPSPAQLVSISSEPTVATTMPRLSTPVLPLSIAVSRDESLEVRKIKSTAGHMITGSMSSGTPKSLIGSTHKSSKAKGKAQGVSVTAVTPSTSFSCGGGSTLPSGYGKTTKIVQETVENTPQA